MLTQLALASYHSCIRRYTLGQAKSFLKLVKFIVLKWEKMSDEDLVYNRVPEKLHVWERDDFRFIFL